MGNPVGVSTGVTATDFTKETIDEIIRGERLANPSDLRYRVRFRAGELHEHYEQWENLAGDQPSPQQLQILEWIPNKISIFQFFRPFSGNFKGEFYDSARPPSRQFRNNPSCRPFADFVRRTLLDRLRMGAMSLRGKVGEAKSPFLVLTLTVEPTKPSLCHDARYLNLWMVDMPFSLNGLTNLPRYVGRDTYQTVLDNKSGYDHFLLTEDSREFFGIQWGGWLFVYNALPFGWKISPYVYHSTGLMASNFFRFNGIPCSLYIDDRHNGQLQVSSRHGAYADLPSLEAYNMAAAKSAIFLVAYFLINLGYFLGVSKSILEPRKVVPYLGFLSDSSLQVFHLIPAKREKFIALVRQALSCSRVSVKTLQRLAGKCVSFTLAVLGAILFTREMNNAIAKGLRSGEQVQVYDALRNEIAHWLFLEKWDDPLPWRDERHFRVTLATDASGLGWGGSISLPNEINISDYWTSEEQDYDIATKEALALNKVLLSLSDTLRNAWVMRTLITRRLSMHGRSKGVGVSH